MNAISVTVAAINRHFRRHQAPHQRSCQAPAITPSICPPLSTASSPPAPIIHSGTVTLHISVTITSVVAISVISHGLPSHQRPFLITAPIAPSLPSPLGVELAAGFKNERKITRFTHAAINMLGGYSRLSRVPPHIPPHQSHPSATSPTSKIPPLAPAVQNLPDSHQLSRSRPPRLPPPNKRLYHRANTPIIDIDHPRRHTVSPRTAHTPRQPAVHRDPAPRRLHATLSSGARENPPKYFIPIECYTCMIRQELIRRE
ncbi:hypothetical protein B0H13DRAFT_2403851 [Mycena leptocephala]|nr:hypothetical protein B0H13DRAFT_2403851 [Mycena leptocephala]